LGPLREGAEFDSYRDPAERQPSAGSGSGTFHTQPSSQSFRRIKNEDLLAAELDSAWATKPLALPPSPMK
jgi:hypothetical protein